MTATELDLLIEQTVKKLYLLKTATRNAEAVLRAALEALVRHARADGVPDSTLFARLEPLAIECGCIPENFLYEPTDPRTLKPAAPVHE